MTPATLTRRFHCYSIGTGKTGTHSIAGIFAKNFRSAHEPECEQLISTILRLGARARSGSDVRHFLRARDERLQLDLESDGALYWFLDELLEEFPRSKFILTIRDCYSWLESVFNHNLAYRPEGFWRDFDDFTFSSWKFQHVAQEKVLQDHGLRTLRHYLNHWTTHNRTVIDKTPRERLLVVRTDRIRESAEEIADFLGIPSTALDLTKSNLFRNPRNFNLLASMEPSFVEDSVNECCGELMCEYFPEIMARDSVVWHLPSGA